MSAYAANTAVSSEKSKLEIERMLERYGASQYVSGWKNGIAVIGFTYNERMVRFELALPDRQDPKFTKKKNGWTSRPTTAAQALYEQAVRQRWRALCLVIKAKLESVESSIDTFEDAFLSHIVTPNGQTVGEWLKPQIEEAYANGRMPSLLPGRGESSV
jgi:hypothetical protein